jgi:hypothetical protein
VSIARRGGKEDGKDKVVFFSLFLVCSSFPGLLLLRIFVLSTSRKAEASEHEARLVDTDESETEQKTAQEAEAQTVENELGERLKEIWRVFF